MREGVAKFAAFVDRARGFWRHVARNPTWKRKLRKQALHSLLVRGDIRVYLAVRSLKVGIGNHSGTAMPGSRDIDHIKVVLFDQAVQMSINEIQARRCSPVSQKPRFDVVLGEGLLQQWIVIEIDLADRQVVGRSPICVD